MCPYCGRTMSVWESVHSDRVPNWDHVIPKSQNGGRVGNVVLAHMGCNVDKGARAPRPCELLFCWITNTIVDAMRDKNAKPILPE